MQWNTGIRSVEGAWCMRFEEPSQSRTRIHLSCRVCNPLPGIQSNSTITASEIAVRPERNLCNTDSGLHLLFPIALTWFSLRKRHPDNSASRESNPGMLMTHDMNGSLRLAGRVSVITGGAQGIGHAIAALFQREGACVFILDCDVNMGPRTAEELTSQNPSRPVRYLPADIRDQGQIQYAVNALRKFHDRV